MRGLIWPIISQASWVGHSQGGFLTEIPLEQFETSLFNVNGHM